MSEKSDGQSKITEDDEERKILYEVLLNIKSNDLKFKQNFKAAFVNDEDV